MLYVHRCPSPLGELFLTSDGEALTGLWFGDRKAPVPLPEPPRDCPELPVFAAARRWLELYFSGREPDFTPALRLEGTPFQREVWALLRKVPYGQTVTYGDLAVRLAARRSPARMSAQAVGGAVGRNPIALIVPCHRVIGADGGLTGYAGGQERKRFLLALERGDR